MSGTTGTIGGLREQRNLVTVVGRGHSGTRVIAATLRQSGVFMGAPLNESGDLVPAEDLYEACRVMSRHVTRVGAARWDFSALHRLAVEPRFSGLVESYLASVLTSKAARRGWKLPETTLVLPWIVRLLPEVRYIHWVRDPRDCIVGPHITDDLAAFGAPCDTSDDVRRRRAVSWKYQAAIVRATPRPEHWITVRFEDFVLDQEATLERLGQFLELSLLKIPVDRGAVGLWKRDPELHDFDFLHEDLVEHGYAT